MSSFYDSSTSPDPKVWLSLSVHEQLRLVRNCYARSRDGSVGKLLVLLHLNVETRIARGHGPTVKAMSRLQSRGLSRQEALSAICEALRKVGVFDVPGRATLEDEENQALKQL